MAAEPRPEGSARSGTAPAPLPLLPYLAGLLLAAALLLGGAGDADPLLTLGIELLAILTLWYVWAMRGLAPALRLGWLPWAVLAGTLALPLLQLVPLPYALWRALPGRELAGQIIELAGVERGWRPLTLDPAATIATALELLPAAAIFLSVLHLDRAGRRLLIYLLIGIALLSAVLGALQRTGGEMSPFILFDTPHRGFSPGLFVNRNHQATFLLVAMLLTAAMARTFGSERVAPGMVRLGAMALIGVFAAGVLVTVSRTGFVMLLPTLAASVLTILRIRWNWMWAASLAALIVLLVLFASQSSVVGSTLERFSDVSADERTTYWQDSMVAIGQSFPVGTGIGTFPKVYETVQSIDVVGIEYVNNAHNDYLELLMEGGLAALLLLGLFLAYVVLSGMRLWRARGRPEALIGGMAMGGILTVLFHSIFDFPLRMSSLMAAFGLLCGLLVVAAETLRASAKETRP